MAVLVDAETRLVCQGITGRAGTVHARACIAYGTALVGGVTPGKGGATWTDDAGRGYPVWDTVAEAVRAGANTSLVMVPPRFAAAAIAEALDAGIRLIVAITEGIPVLDTCRIRRRLAATGARLIGPNCPGVISPGLAKAGIMPGAIHRPGSVGIVSRSGTLTYEAVVQTTRAGLGQSTCVGIGGDPVIGCDFVDCLRLFEADPATDRIVMIGEIGGDAEERACACIRTELTKPVAGFVAGRHAPPGKRMGHAGAIVAGATGTAAGKLAALREAGATLIEHPADIGAAAAALPVAKA